MPLGPSTAERPDVLADEEDRLASFSDGSQEEHRPFERGRCHLRTHDFDVARHLQLRFFHRTAGGR